MVFWEKTRIYFDFSEFNCFVCNSFFSKQKTTKKQITSRFWFFFFGLFFSCFFLDFFSWVRHKLALMMPNCPETKVSSYDACLYLMQRRARMALCCLDTKACTYTSWLSVTHTLPMTRRGALMMPGCPWHEGVLRITFSCPWHIGLLLCCLSFLTQRCALMMPGGAWHKRSQWHKGLLIWCPVVLDTQVCSYDAWLSLTQRYALMTQTLFMTQALIWHESFLLWRLAVVDTQVPFYNARLYLTKKCGLMMPSCRWHEGLLLWCMAAIDTKLCSYDARLSLTQQICSFDALLSLRQWFALMISGCSWHKGL